MAGRAPSVGPPERRVAEGGPDPAEQAIHAAIARQLRDQRRQLGFTVAQLSERSGISKGMLSKIENAQASPSLATLGRLASALGVPVTSFFRGLEEEHDALHVRSGAGLDIVRRGTRVGHRYQLLGSVRGAAKRIEPVLVTLTEESEVFPLFQHAGTEFIYMLRGRMTYGYGSTRYLMRPGDALEFEGDVPHGPVELTKLPITFLSIIATGSVSDGDS